MSNKIINIDNLRYYNEKISNRLTNIENNVGNNNAYSEVSHGTADTAFTLTPNAFHIWDEVASLTLTLGDETVGVANEFLFQFNSGATATTLTLPDTIKWANDSAPTIEANKIYQISILKGLGSVLVFDNMITFIIDGTEYQAEYGMTWRDWVNSDYNTGSYLIGDNTTVLKGSGTVILNEVSVSPSDLIIAGTNYYIRKQPSASGGTDD